MIDETNAGRRVELVWCDDPYTNLAPRDRGTYEHANVQPSMTQHSIAWDNGSNMMLIEGHDVFLFIT